jgi:hypothetical protein
MQEEVNVMLDDAECSSRKKDDDRAGLLYYCTPSYITVRQGQLD